MIKKRAQHEIDGECDKLSAVVVSILFRKRATHVFVENIEYANRTENRHSVKIFKTVVSF